MIPDPATLLRGMGANAGSADPMQSVAPAIQVAIMDAGKGGCSCSSCQALIKVQDALRASLSNVPAAPG